MNRPAAAARRRTLLTASYALLLLSCDNPLSPKETTVSRLSVTPTSMTLVAGETRPALASVVGSDGKTSNERKVFWSTQNPAVATVSQTGIVSAVAPGNTQVAASAGGKSAVLPVTVNPRPVSLVRVLPSPAQVLDGGTVTLTAEAVDASGGILSGRTVIWASNNTAIATVTSTGVVTGVAPGTMTVTATVDGVSGNGVVTVQPVPVASVTVTPNTEQLIVGQSAQLSATVLDGQNNVLTGRVVTWESNRVTVASVSSTGLVTGVGAGTATITARIEGKSGTSEIVVSLVPVDTVSVSPSAATIAAGNTVQLSARLADSHGNVLAGRVVTWTSEQPAIATVNGSGLVTGISSGAARIIATSEGTSGGGLVTVTPVPVASIVIDPPAASLLVGGKQQFTAATLDAAGKPLPGRQVTWISGAPSVATVDKTGLVTAIGAGSAVIFAASEGQSANVTVTVSSVGVAQVRITPPSGTVQQGQSLQLTGEALDAAGQPIPGKLITWSSSNSAVATVSSTGLVTGIAAGIITITATSDGVSGTVPITVTQVSVATVTIVPNSATLQVSGTFGLTAVLADAQGNPIPPAGRQIVWTSSNTSVATVTATGFVTGVSAGATIVSAASGTAVGTANITVTDIPVASVTLAPPSNALQVGQTANVTATAKDNSGATLTGRPVTWASNNPTIATVNTATTAPTNTITAVGVGSTTITATVGGVQGVATVSVTIIPIATIVVTPNPATLEEGQTLQLTVTLRDASNNILSPTGRTIVWSSNNPQMSVSQSGLVTAVAGTGGQTATITVSAPGGGAGGASPSGTAGLTATYTPVASATVAPSSASVTPGGQTTFSATLLGAASQTLSSSGRSVVWSSTNPLVATINASSGVATGVIPGVDTIIVVASSPGQATPVRDSAVLTVSLVPVANVSVSPSPATVYVGTVYARTLTALVTDIASHPLSGRQVTWTSGSTSIGTVSPASSTTDANGQAQTTVTGVAVGSVNITATATGGIAGAANVTVALVPVSSVTVAPLSAALTPPGTQQLTATPFDSASQTISGASLGGRTTSWASDNPSAASVGSSTGLVTAVGAGTANVSATIGGTVSATPSVITVSVPVSQVSVVASPDSIIGTATTTVTITVFGPGSVPLAGRSVTISAPPGVSLSATSGTTDGAGHVSVTVTGVSPGTASIQALSGGITGSADIRVLASVATVSVTTSPDSLIGLGGTSTPSVTLRDASNNVLSGRPVAWTSSNTAVATVSPTTGVATAVGAGTANIVATVEGKTGTAALRVLEPVFDVNVTVPADSVIGSSITQQTLVVLTSSTGATLTGRPITYSSKSAAIAAVSASGLVSGVTTGSTYIRAAAEGQIDSVLVRSLAPINSIALVVASDSIIVGTADLPVTATATDAGSNGIGGRILSIASSSTGVATVSAASGISNGSGQVSFNVHGVASGTSTISVTAEGKSVSFVVRILAPVSSIVVTAPGDSIIGTGTLQATASLRDAANHVLTGRPTTWSSLNTARATVDASTGLITGVAPGPVTIRATSEGVDGDLSVRILAPVASVTVTAPDSSIEQGQSVQAGASLRDASNNILTGRPVTWQSSNTAKATVSSTGVILAVDTGTVTITATAEGQSGSIPAFTVTLAPISSVTFNPTSLNVPTGNTKQSIITVRRASGATLPGRTCSILSNNTAVASVSPNGTALTGSLGEIDVSVTGVGSGSTTVTATCEGVTGTLTVTVP